MYEHLSPVEKFGEELIQPPPIPFTSVKATIRRSREKGERHINFPKNSRFIRDPCAASSYDSRVKILTAADLARQFIRGESDYILINYNKAKKKRSGYTDYHQVVRGCLRKAEDYTQRLGPKSL